MHALFRHLGLSLIAVASLALGGCAHHASQSRNDMRNDMRNDWRNVPSYDNRANVQYGHVRSIEQDFSGDRPGRSERSSAGGGALVGGVIGGVIGNQVGKGSGRAAATVIGAVGGAILGNEIERQNQQQNQQQYQQQQYAQNAPYPRNAQRERGIFHVLVRLDNRSEEWFDFERVDGLRVGDRVRIENGRLQRY